MSKPYAEKTRIHQPRPFPKLPTNKGKVFLSCRNLCYKNIVKDVCFDVYEGEILGIVGISGSGRSTIARLISGDLHPSLGKTFIKGHPVNLKNTSVATRNKITLISDDAIKYMLIPTSNLTENVSLNNYKNVCVKAFPFIIKNRKLKSICLSVITRLGISYQSLDQKAQDLSAGNQKKIAFSRSIMSGSQLFLLDEPTLHVDNAGKLQIYNIMNELSREGKSIVFFTADIDEALGMCDRLLVLRSGAITCEYINDSVPAEEIFEKLYL
jgi:ABC-type sugar transport system ATPase subunit